MSDWATMDSAPKDKIVVDGKECDHIINLFCPGVSPATRGVLQGYWDTRLKGWILNSYGQTQPTVLYPSRWCEVEMPPAKDQPAT